MIFLIIFFIILIVVVLRLYFNNRFLVKKFNDNNVIVFGAKGTGKDLLFQNVIRLQKNKPYYSNINYGYKYNHILLKDLSVSPNTYENFILGNISLIPKNNEMEGKHVYLSDLGVILPSQMDTQLTKLFPSFPIYYALSRHLYNQNIHGNSQALNRIWIKIREQADHYFHCRTSFKIGPFMFTRAIYYSEYKSAEQRILPMKIRGLNNNVNRALIEQHRAQFGEISSRYFVQPVKKIKYNTREYHKILFGFVYIPKKDNEKEKLRKAVFDKKSRMFIVK